MAAADTNWSRSHNKARCFCLFFQKGWHSCGAVCTLRLWNWKSMRCMTEQYHLFSEIDDEHGVADVYVSGRMLVLSLNWRQPKKYKNIAHMSLILTLAAFWCVILPVLPC